MNAVATLAIAAVTAIGFQDPASPIPFAKDWKEAEARARAEQKLVLAIVQAYPGLTIPDGVAERQFLEPELLDLVQLRFVPLKVTQIDQVPFAEPDRYGLGPHTFGASLLVVTADGDVIGDTFTAGDSAWIDEYLRGVLAERGEDDFVPPAKGDAVADKIARAELRAKRGELDEARRELSGVDTLRAALLRARIERRLREGNAARKELARASELAEKEQAPAELRAEVELEIARTAVGCGDVELAREALERGRALAAEGAKESAARSIAAEIASDLGMLHYCLREYDDARRVWSELVRDHPRSAAALVPSLLLADPASFEIGFAIDPRWPSRELIASLELAPPAAEDESGPVDAERAEREALERLLADQRPDGSWFVGTDSATFRFDRPDALRIAVTAIAAQSLLPERADPKIAAALEKTVAWLVAEEARVQQMTPMPEAMVYWGWARAYTLWFFADAVACGFVERGALGEAPALALADLKARQMANGGWTYLVSTDPKKVDEPLPVSMSFMTAAVVTALEEARRAGFDVPEEMTKRALDLIESAAAPNVTFEYMRLGSEKTQRALVPVELVGGSGRAPFCAFVLERAGRKERKHVEVAMRRFFEHLPDLARESGKTLMHCGPQGLGSHYVLFDCANAARVMAALPECGPPGSHESLAEHILAARRADGTFVDNPLLGRAYGTAMALQALRFLRTTR